MAGIDTAPLLTRMRMFGGKIETTTGTPITITAADAKTPVTSDPANPIITYDTEVIDRPNNVSLSKPKKRHGARSGKAVFETELYGAGAPGVPSWTKYLLACGMQNTGGVFTPITGATTTMTQSSFLGNGAITKTIAGAMGNLVITIKRGQPAIAAWTFSGKAAPAGTATISVPTFDTIVAPTVAEASFLIDDIKYYAPDLVIDFGNVVILRQDLNDDTGYHSAYITDRAPTVRVSPEAIGLGTKDWYADHLDGVTVPLTITLGTEDNNTIIIAFPNLQLNTDPNEGDRDGTAVSDLEFLAVQATPAGNDEYSFTFPVAA